VALRRVVKPATALAAAWAILLPGCGGTLEGKYRRGQLPTTSTSGPRAPAGPGPTAPSTTTTTTVPTSGNAGRPYLGPGSATRWSEPSG
jgi:hypothetical protein